MRILVTGSSGWLGRNVADLLRTRGIEFVGLDVAPGEHTSEIGSIADAGLVDRIMRDNIAAVVHTAALHKPQLELRRPSDFVSVNVGGTLNLLEAAVKYRVPRFVMTSTTSVMVTQQIHNGGLSRALFLDEQSGPLAPRNLYGVTKLAAEGLCRAFHLRHGLSCIVLRTSRFFPEEDDAQKGLSGPNLKANELLFRRLSVEDAARAHLVALDQAESLGFDLFVLSAPTPFRRRDADRLATDAPGVVLGYFPQAAEIYAALDWRLPARIDRVYDSTRAQQVLGFTFEHDFGTLLRSLSEGAPSPLRHDPRYRSPVDLIDSEELSGHLSRASEQSVTQPAGSVSADHRRDQARPSAASRDRDRDQSEGHG